MPKFPWKRGAESTTDEAAVNTYLPSQPVDYTTMPVVEEAEGRLAAFKRLPALARIAFLLVPVLLIGGGLWAAYQFLAVPTPQVAAKPRPEVALGEARLVNVREITVEGETRNVPDGAKVSGQLIVDEEIATWADQELSAGEVKQGRFKLRLRRLRDWNDQFEATAAYSVEVTIASQPPAVATQGLIVPAQLADEFYAVTEVAAAPTPQPTTPPPPPTATPQAGPPTLVVGAQATMLISPTLGTQIIGTPPQGASYEPLMRTPDSRFFLVMEGDMAGWLPAEQVTIDPAQALRIPVTTPPAGAAEAGEQRATVFNGGNIRYRPSVQTGTVLGQMHAHQTVTIKERTADGKWFHVVAPEAEGWVSVTLLTIDPQVAAQVPVAQ